MTWTRTFVIAFFQCVAALGLILLVFAKAEWPGATIEAQGITTAIPDLLTQPAGDGRPLYIAVLGAGLLIVGGLTAGVLLFRTRN
ncbi:MAG: hypothetical protein AAF288_03010 [Planctomycetota bacterium]